MPVAFELDRRAVTGLNGGPVLTFNAAVSFQVLCESRQEVDFYGATLAEGDGDWRRHGVRFNSSRRFDRPRAAAARP